MELYPHGTIHFISVIGKRHKRVTHIELNSNSVEGSLSPYVGNLSFLRTLSLGNNSFQGTIPNEVGRLSRLRGNQLTGSLHPAIGGMLPYLVSLQLRDNQLVPISNYFEVFENKFSGKIKIDFSKLRDIYFISMGINNFGTKEQDEMNFIDSLKNCSKLVTLALPNCNFQGVLPWSIGNLSSQLKHLFLNGNQLHGNVPTSTGNLVGLETLSLAGNQFEGNIPSTIGNLQNLGVLVLSFNQLSGQIPHAMENLSSLTKLYLSSNMLNGVIPSSLGNCRNLLALILYGNKLCGKIPKQLLQVSSLSIILDLSKNNLFGSLPTEVGYLDKLTILDLSENNLSGAIPISLGDCGSLLGLSLKGNLFQGVIPQSLSSLKPLMALDISYNKFLGMLPTSSFPAIGGMLPYLVSLQLRDSNEAEVVNDFKKEANTKTIIEECVSSTVKIGVSCSMDSPTQRMDIKNVVHKLQHILNTLQNI
ncbi:hypothetical protein E3N88_13069 [Mikania micrantha]|uniref:Disease resistance R13L4/SHOC-2-like LRR domain-containing protein n=1 Tax=Mikania micrantha TaxID=192012 RepID=A0A5N6P7F3_9ASTR|nr:hypothetical protein E3N88_13069 [Mikania micrantha]